MNTIIAYQPNNTWRLFAEGPFGEPIELDDDCLIKGMGKFNPDELLNVVAKWIIKLK